MIYAATMPDWGFWIVIAVVALVVEATTTSFFTIYFFARVVVNDGPWPPPPYELPVYLALLNTIILVTSSFSMHWALQSIKRNNRSGLIAGLALTFGLGLTFLLIQATEYTRLGFGPSDLAFGSTFYGLTGLHGAHVFVGLNLLAFALIRSIRGHYGPAPHDHTKGHQTCSSLIVTTGAVIA